MPRFNYRLVSLAKKPSTVPFRVPPLGSDEVERIVVLTFEDPPAEATHWTGAMMAKAVVSVSSVQRV
jgi:hypothetical protein